MSNVTGTQENIQPKGQGLLGRRPTYFAFVPVWNEGQPRQRDGHLIRVDRKGGGREAWRVRSNKDVYDAMADQHDPHVILPPGRFQAQAALTMVGVKVAVLTDAHLQAITTSRGDGTQTVALAMAEHWYPGDDGGVIYV